MFMRITDAPTCQECGSFMFPNDGKVSCVNCGTVADSPPPAEPPWEPRHKYDVQPLAKTVVRETVAPVMRDETPFKGVADEVSRLRYAANSKIPPEERIKGAWANARRRKAILLNYIDHIIAENQDGPR